MNNTQTPTNGQAFRNRRYKIWRATVLLLSGSFLYCSILGLDLEWFVAFAKPVIYAGIVIGLGLSATDAIWNWKVGNGGK